MRDSPHHSLLYHGFPGPGRLHPHGDCLPDRTGDTPSIQPSSSGDLLRRKFISMVLILPICYVFCLYVILIQS